MNPQTAYILGQYTGFIIAVAIIAIITYISTKLLNKLISFIFRSKDSKGKDISDNINKAPREHGNK